MTPSRQRLAHLGKLVLFFVLIGTNNLQASQTAAGFDALDEGPLSPAQSGGTAESLPTIEAYRLGQSGIKLDGVLDEEAWSQAPTGWGFRQFEPERGAAASVPTTFKVVYDDQALYFGVACWEEDVANISSFLSRRDQIEASDVVSIYLDPYHDRTTGYNFRISPAGVLTDAYMYDNGNRDTDWNAVWEAEVSHDAKGWYVEVRIPFSAMRFKPADDMTWGLQVYRWMHGRGEDTGWVLWERNVSGFVSRWGTLTGLRNIENPRKLEVLPYVVAKATDPAAPDGPQDSWQDFQNLGADLKYGLTSNLTLNATFQPDFGQVEADPATLNLSPFETYFQEKRPFFTEGARFFQHPNFNLFYSRRIGTGDPLSRIRAAAKLTGKIGGDFSLAVLGAATDVGLEGKVHNPLAAGSQKAYYSLVRVGKEFAEGNHRINFMGTAVNRNRESFAGITNPRLLRDGYSGGMDFEMNFDDRNFRVAGSAVGTLVDNFGHDFDPSLPSGKKYGTGGRLNMSKRGGKWRGYLGTGWEHDALDPNDMGFLSAPDEKYISGGGSYHFDTDGQDRAFNRGNFEIDASSSWLYASNRGLDINSGQEAWSYGKGHRQSQRIGASVWAQHRSYHQGYLHLSRRFSGTSKYSTRHFDGQRGPLFQVPAYWSFSWGLTSDWRKPLSLDFDGNAYTGDGQEGLSTRVSVRWNQNQHLSHWAGLGWQHNINQAQWMTNLANDGSQPGVSGIGGVDYVFGQLDQMTWDMTLRSSILFNRDQSLQIYLQPYLTYGNYSDPRWLATADSYDLRSYDLDAAGYDFNFAALNLNLVYRWEYRPGSTFYLVWTHSKDHYQERNLAANPHSWSNEFKPSLLVDSEPQNTFLAKLTYWFNI